MSLRSRAVRRPRTALTSLLVAAATLIPATVAVAQTDTPPTDSPPSDTATATPAAPQEEGTATTTVPAAAPDQQSTTPDTASPGETTGTAASAPVVQVAVAAPDVQPVDDTSYTNYTVLRGDYLYGISRKNNVTLDALLTANNLRANSVIMPGQVLRIPKPGMTPTPPSPPAATPPASGAQGTYTIVRGDSLYGIAAKTATPINTLLSLNGLTLRSVIFPGQVLKTSAGGSAGTTPAPPPASTPPSGATGTYTVRSGDALYSIAAKTGTPIKTLLALNGLSLNSMIHPGQVLKTAPGAVTPAPPASWTPPPSNGGGQNGLPANSGAGRRLVFSRAQQRVWAVDANGTVVRSWYVSGRLNIPYAGTFQVFSRSASSYYSAEPSVVFRYMVRFTKGPGGDNIGFHEIPTQYGRPVQSTSQLGQPLSSGCLRQSTADAQFVWNWASLGTKVVVL